MVMIDPSLTLEAIYCETSLLNIRISVKKYDIEMSDYIIRECGFTFTQANILKLFNCISNIPISNIAVFTATHIDLV